MILIKWQEVIVMISKKMPWTNHYYVEIIFKKIAASNYD